MGQYVKEREREREKHTQTDRKRERQRERESDTSWVYAQTGIPKAHPSPKSVSLIAPLALINRSHDE